MKFLKIDYERHFWAGAALFFAGVCLGNFFLSIPIKPSLLIGSAAVIAGAAGREWYNLKFSGTGWDWRDFRYTLLGGAAIGAFFVLITIVIPYFLN